MTAPEQKYVDANRAYNAAYAAHQCAGPDKFCATLEAWDRAGKDLDAAYAALKHDAA